MYSIILALHIFVCFLLIIAVLLQNGKGSDLGAALGGGSGEMFGPKAPANVMNKITTVIAACFVVLSLTLAILSGKGSESIMKRIPVDTPTATEQVAPATGSELPGQIAIPDNIPPSTVPATDNAGAVK